MAGAADGLVIPTIQEQGRAENTGAFDALPEEKKREIAAATSQWLKTTAVASAAADALVSSRYLYQVTLQSLQHQAQRDGVDPAVVDYLVQAMAYRAKQPFSRWQALKRASKTLMPLLAYELREESRRAAGTDKGRDEDIQELEKLKHESGE